MPEKAPKPTADSGGGEKNNTPVPQVRNTALAHVYDIIERLRGKKDLAVVGDALHEIIDARHWNLLVADENEKNNFMMSYVVSDGAARRKLHNVYNIFNSGLVQTAANSGDPIFVRSVLDDKRFSMEYDAFLGQGEKVMRGPGAFIPLVATRSSRMVGVLAVMDWEPGVTEEGTEQRDLLVITCSILALIIENIITVRALRRVALTDHLTGLYNRRSLVSIVDRVIEECVRYKRSMSLAVIDIDNFKAINDTCGHLKGDEVLVNLAGILNASVRKLDYVMRFAGDEFVVVMPDTTRESADIVMNRIRKNFETSKLQTIIAYSISMGSYSGPPRDIGYMFSQADIQMYKEKEESKEESSDAGGDDKQNNTRSTGRGRKSKSEASRAISRSSKQDLQKNAKEGSRKNKSTSSGKSAPNSQKKVEKEMGVHPGKGGVARSPGERPQLGALTEDVDIGSEIGHKGGARGGGPAPAAALALSPGAPPPPPRRGSGAGAQKKKSTGAENPSEGGDDGDGGESAEPQGVAALSEG